MKITYKANKTEDVNISTSSELLALLEEKDIDVLEIGDYSIDGCLYTDNGYWCYVYDVYNRKKREFVAKELFAEDLVSLLIDLGAIKQGNTPQK